jgi:transcriptional regulator with XRE-family HTH domain
MTGVARLGLQGMKVDQSIISKIENGSRPVYDYELPKIAKALKVTVGWVLKEK